MECEVTNMKRVIGALLLCAAPLVASCSEIRGGPFEGVVIDEVSRRPVEGATVVVKWLAAMSGANGPWYPCYHVEVATSDREGRFRVAPWIVNTQEHDAAPLIKNLSAINTSKLDKPIETFVYAPGLSGPEKAWAKRDTAIVPVHRFDGSESERIEMLYQLGEKVSGCVGGKILTPTRTRMYEEAKAAARTPPDRRRADGILAGIEVTEFGPQVARERSAEREGKRKSEGSR
jgi:hypothetical protein